VDEDLRREQRLTAAGAPSLRRLMELERLATALTRHGERQPPVAVFQLPELTSDPVGALRHLRFAVEGDWENLGREPPPRRIQFPAEALEFRYRGLERFERGDPLRPTFEARPHPDLPPRSPERAVWVVMAEFVVEGIVSVAGGGAFEPVLNRFDATFVRTRGYIHDFRGPVVVTLLLEPMRLA
jgi:hypothetical protein